MKKAILFVALVAFALPLFADDAVVLPQGVGRIRIIPVLTTVTGSYDDSGSLTDNKDDARDQDPDEAIWAIGGAFEYGVTNQISIGLRWAPAYQFFADADATGSSSYDAQTGGFEHIDVGAEIQILGEQGFVGNEQFRFSVTPGVGIPMPENVDWAAEGTNAARQQDFINPTSLNQTEAQIGLLLNADYVINETFEVNVFTEGRYRFGRTREVKDYFNSLADTASAGTALDAIENPYSTYDIEFGPNLLWEAGIEPKASFQVADPLRLDVGLTTKFSLNTAQDRTTTATFANATQQTLVTNLVGAQAALGQAGLVTSNTDSTTEGDTSYTLRFEPSVGAFITALPLPLELTAQYSIPLMGQNVNATQSAIFQLRAYFRF